MNEKQNYPARGKMSADGRYYTHTDGSVHVQKKEVSKTCAGCSVAKCEGFCLANCTFETRFALVEGAHVSTAEESEACQMAREAICLCGNFRGLALLVRSRQSCARCSWLADKRCPARAYLDKHGDPNAWEVQT